MLTVYGSCRFTSPTSFSLSGFQGPTGPGCGIFYNCACSLCFSGCFQGHVLNPKQQNETSETAETNLRNGRNEQTKQNHRNKHLLRANSKLPLFKLTGVLFGLTGLYVLLCSVILFRFVVSGFVHAVFKASLVRLYPVSP